MSISRDEAEAYRQAQAGVRVLVERDLARFWAKLDFSRPDWVASATRAYVPLLVRRYGSAAADLAASWYDEQRALAGLDDAFRAEAFASPYEDAVDGMVGRALGRVSAGDAAGALTALTSNTAKYVLGAGRATIARNVDRDPSASGWQRVTRAGACEFCRGLAGRGGVYKRTTVHFAAHGSCNCAAVPSWDASAPEVDVRAYEASQRMTVLRMRAAAGDRSAQRQLDAHNARIREWLGES